MVGRTSVSADTVSTLIFKPSRGAWTIRGKTPSKALQQRGKKIPKPRQLIDHTSRKTSRRDPGRRSWSRRPRLHHFINAYRKNPSDGLCPPDGRLVYSQFRTLTGAPSTVVPKGDLTLMVLVGSGLIGEGRTSSVQAPFASTGAVPITGPATVLPLKIVTRLPGATKVHVPVIVHLFAKSLN